MSLWNLALLLAAYMFATPLNENHNQSKVLEAKVDAYLAPYLSRKDFSGSVLIAVGDTILLNKAYGKANYELSVPNTPNTKFQIASVTKTFTAAAIALLQERKLLSITDTLSKYIPDFAHGNKITIRHLLRHESGVSNPDYLSYSKPLTHQELVEQISSKPLQFQPGTDGQYSNAGFNILAYVVKRVSGMSYDEFLRKNIFEPLGMKNTGGQSDAVVKDLASPYLPGPPPTGVVRAPWRYDGLSTGSGSLYSTTHDLYRWLTAVHRKELFDITALEYPYGWGRINKWGYRGVEQSGLTTGYTSYIAAYFERGLYIVVLTNTEAIRWNKWGQDLAAIALGQEYEQETVPMGVSVEGKDLDRCVGVYQQEQQIIRIVNRNNSLWVYSGDWPIGKYLLPTSPSTYALRSDFGTIFFENVEDNKYQKLIWRFNENAKAEYQRKK